MNIARRHTNRQKGVQQNGIGHDNGQQDELSWRRGKAHTSDVQENVTQNGIGKRNNKSFRRINEMFRNLFNGESDRKHGSGKHHSNRRKNSNISRRYGNSNDRTDGLKRSSETLQKQTEAIKTMLCNTITALCNEIDRPTRRAINEIAKDNWTHTGNISVSQGASPSRYNRKRPSITDKYDEIIFLPNYEIELK